MLFNSATFFLFFPIVTAVYFLLPHKHRWWFLLLASCVFYMAFIPEYLLILVITIGIDYFAALWIEQTSGSEKKLWLWVSILSTVAVLGIFKYYNFFVENINDAFQGFGFAFQAKHRSIILPIGLSFHTFQSLSYVIEVYRGNQKAERHFGIYSLYVMFYPQLVAGPIERPQNLLHQFYENHELDVRRIIDGLKLMTWGMFKKIVIADRMSTWVDPVYRHPRQYSGLALIFATVAFAFQIYCDFSGYTDIAIGAAKVMGFTLMRNFRQPYFARSISEFWSRWHISLSTWFRDYVYIPLGGNRRSSLRWQFNLLVTFLLSGLWHGAKFTFIIWGALNGVYLIFSIWTQSLRKKLVQLSWLGNMPIMLSSVRILATFALISLSWIFFRSDSVSDALYIIRHLFSGPFTLETLPILPSDICVGVVCLLILLGFDLCLENNFTLMLKRSPSYLRYSAYAALLSVIVLLGLFHQTQFLYFQF